MFLLNHLGKTDKAFFIIIGVLVAVAIAIYFLIPVFKHKQYQEQINNLHAREEAFNSNREKSNK